MRVLVTVLYMAHFKQIFLFFLFFRYEISILRKIYNILSTFASLQHTYDSVICLIAFITLIFTGIRLTPFNVFTMVGLLSENRRSLVYGLTDGMQLIADCFASLERIESFLLIEELNGNGKDMNQSKETSKNEAEGDKKAKAETNVEPFLKVRLWFVWSTPKNLTKINLGQIIIIISLFCHFFFKTSLQCTVTVNTTNII